jgi:high-affinity nickel permease
MFPTVDLAADNLKQVAGLIALSVAPIFLLTAVAATLAVLAQRLARIVDRGRSLETRAAADKARRLQELGALEKRARLIYRALTLGVGSALCICLLMTLAFAGALLGFNTAKPVAFLFLIALFSYTAALVCLLREVFLAVGTFGLHLHDAAESK